MGPTLQKKIYIYIDILMHNCVQKSVSSAACPGAHRFLKIIIKLLLCYSDLVTDGTKTVPNYSPTRMYFIPKIGGALKGARNFSNYYLTIMTW